MACEARTVSRHVTARVSARTCGPFIVVPDADHVMRNMISQFGLARSSALYQLQVGSDSMMGASSCMLLTCPAQTFRRDMTRIEQRTRILNLTTGLIASARTRMHSYTHAEPRYPQEMPRAKVGADACASYLPRWPERSVFNQLVDSPILMSPRLRYLYRLTHDPNEGRKGSALLSLLQSPVLRDGTCARVLCAQVCGRLSRVHHAMSMYFQFFSRYVSTCCTSPLHSRRVACNLCA